MNYTGKRFVPFRDEIGMRTYYGVYDNALEHKLLNNIGEETSHEIAVELNNQINEPKGEETNQFLVAKEIYEKNGGSYW
jgi:hypothetical protein